MPRERFSLIYSSVTYAGVGFCERRGYDSLAT